MSKLSVCVVFGGNSTEHDISCLSAQNIVTHLNRDKYDVITLGITRDGRWLLYEGDAAAIGDGSWERGSVKRAVISPDTADHGILIFHEGGVIVRRVDVVYLALHGKNGEDGTIQGLLELAGIPYAGAGVLASALCMDKAEAKVIFQAGGIPQADWLVFRPWHMEQTHDVLRKVHNRFSYPVFVKPSAAGSSIGASKVQNDSQLLEALTQAFRHDSKVMVEEYIDAMEVETAVIGNSRPQVAVPGMIRTDYEFYDFEAKYTDGKSEMVVPAPISEEQAGELQQYAKQAYLLAGCTGYARVDFFIERGSGRILLNEINTIPGHTKYSMFHVMWAECGVPFSELLDRIIGFALE